jgi:hypothetical protein
MLKKIALISLCIVFLSGCWETSRGQKIGMIIKLADEGILIKTHEGQMIRGGMSNGSGSFGVHPFDFTMESIDSYNTAIYAMDHQKEVRITYHTELMTLFRCESNNVFVDKIEIIP